MGTGGTGGGLVGVRGRAEGGLAVPVCLSAAQQNAGMDSVPLESHWNPEAMCVTANSGARKPFQAQPTSGWMTPSAPTPATPAHKI